MRYLLCALAVLTVTACSSPSPETGSAGTHAPASGPGTTSGSSSSPDAGSGTDSGPTAGAGPSSASGPGPESASGSGQDRMIGYRLKRLDQLIEITFDRLLGNAGMNRREWRTLNTISLGPADEAHLTDALRPFWEGNGESVSDVIAGLAARGWTHRDAEGRYALTPAGRSAHTAAMTEVSGLRERMTAGISAEEFSRMMDVLQRMTVNLETP